MLTPVFSLFSGRSRQIKANRGEPYDTLALTRAEFRAPGEAPDDVLLGRCHRPHLGLDFSDQPHVFQEGARRFARVASVGESGGKDANISRRRDTGQTSGPVGDPQPTNGQPDGSRTSPNTGPLLATWGVAGGSGARNATIFHRCDTGQTSGPKADFTKRWVI